MADKALRLPEPIDKALKGAQRPFIKIAESQGNIVQWPAESMFALQALANNSLLQKCDPITVRDAIVNVAAIGLSLNPQLQHCALIPRYNTRAQVYQCHADPMYQGLLKLATDGGAVLSVWCNIVYKGEAEDHRFSYSVGTNPYIKHEPDPFITQKMENAIGAYCCAEIRGASHIHVTFMGRDDVMKARNASDMIKKALKEDKPIRGPWADWEDQMWCKTVLKRASKMWPKGSGRLETAVHLANVAEGYIEPRRDDIVIPPEVVQCVTEDQAKELRQLCRDAKMRVERVYKAYNIKTMEKLPSTEFESCKKRCTMAKLTGVLKNADSEALVFADDYGLTFAELEGFGAEHKTKAKLLTRRPADG